MPPSDRYAQYRRTDPTAPERHSTTSYLRSFLAKLVAELPASIQKEIEDDMQHLWSMQADLPADRTDGNGTSFIPPMHWHPRTIVSPGKGLLALRSAAELNPPPPPAASAAERVISYWTSADSLKLLHRFLDCAQPGLGEMPLPDGSNIMENATGDYPHQSLLHEWMFNRIFVRFLHLPGLWFGAESREERLEAFAYIYGVSRCLLEWELQRFSVTDGEHDEYCIEEEPERDWMSWVQPCRDRIKLILDDVAKVAYEEHQPLSSRFFPGRQTASSSLTPEEKLQRNLEPDSMNLMLNKMIKKYEELMVDHPFERLVMDLLAKEDTFERLLAQEHIDDKLINKQIIPYDEVGIVEGPEYSAYTIDRSFNEDQITPRGLLLERLIYKMSANISMVNRQRRNFRLMREWLKARPWFLIIHAYNSSIPGNEWQAGAIKRFLGAGLRDVYHEHDIIPTHPQNVRCNLFGILPFDVQEFSSQNKDLFSCGVCHGVAKGGNDPTNTFVMLDCPQNHSFHLGCVMWCWDREGKYLHNCPTCGDTPNLNYVRLGMNRNTDDPYFNTRDPTFVDNVFGHTIRHPKPPKTAPLTSYDLSRQGLGSLYWQRENLLSAAMARAPVHWCGGTLRSDRPFPTSSFARRISTMWRLRNVDIHGEGDVAELKIESARFTPSVEIAWLRSRRRVRDRARRRRIYEAGQGLRRYTS